MKFISNRKNQKGQLLLEILVAIAVVVVIVAFSANLTYVSMVSTKSAAEKNVSFGLVDEAFEALNGVATEKWQNLYNLNKNSNYYLQASSTFWAVATGTESVVINGLTYSRSFTVQNICRDNSTRSITGLTDSNGSSTTCTATSSSPDPSTQKVNVTVSWPDADPINSGQYLTRWRNKVCSQTSWSAQGSGTSSCPTTIYDSSNNLTTGGNLQLTP